MDWTPLLATHVVAALYALLLGPINILRRRRDRAHRILGLTWAASMYYVCLSSFWIMSAGHYTWLHGLSAFTMVTVTLGILGAMTGNTRGHVLNMVGSYLGLVVAFGFAATVPTRAIPKLIMGEPATAAFAAALIAAGVLALYLTVRPGRPRTDRPRARRRRRPSAARRVPSAAPAWSSRLPSSRR